MPQQVEHYILYRITIVWLLYWTALLCYMYSECLYVKIVLNVFHPQVILLSPHRICCQPSYLTVQKVTIIALQGTGCDMKRCQICQSPYANKPPVLHVVASVSYWRYALGVLKIIIFGFTAYMFTHSCFFSSCFSHLPLLSQTIQRVIKSLIEGKEANSFMISWRVCVYQS